MSLDLARRVLEIEARAIESLIARLDESFLGAVDLLASCPGRVITSGMGKSGLICRKITATLNSTGTASFYLHPGEALHGDLGMIARGDVFLALSNSGETAETLQLLPVLERLRVPLVAVVGRTGSSLAKAASFVLDVSVEREACPLGLSPTASTTAALALGDALAMAVLARKGFTEEDFAGLHPAGQLGFKLMKVEALMHTGDSVPLVTKDTPMREVIYEMSRKQLGVTAVLDEEGKLAGIISDGDLRRQLERDEHLLSRHASDCMTGRPVTIDGRALASEALALMEERKITCLLVPDSEGRVAGIVHLHDLFGRADVSRVG